MKTMTLQLAILVIALLGSGRPCLTAPEFAQEAPKLDEQNSPPVLQGDVKQAGPLLALQQYGYLGFHCVREGKSEFPAKVIEVDANSPAARAMLTPNDVIVSATKKGGGVELEVKRDGKVYLAKVGEQEGSAVSSDSAGQSQKVAAGNPVQGRIEQIGQADTRLPIELTTAKSSFKLNGQKNGAGLSGFSSKMLGCWGGGLTTTYYIYNPGYADLYRQTGTTCKVVFNFIKSHGDIVVKPPTLFFPWESRILDSSTLPTDAGPRRWAWEVPTIALGNSVWVDRMSSATVEQDRIIHNTFTKLGPQVMEQDIVSEIDRPGKPVRYAEIVFRFTQVDTGLMLAQVARVEYEADRSPFRRWLWEGMVSPNWQVVANQIAAEFRMTLSDYERKYPESATWLNNGSAQ